MSELSTLAPVHLAPLAQRIRHENVLIDSDLANLYGVAVKLHNQAVKRNIERFPGDFMFRETPGEFAILRQTPAIEGSGLRSQNVIPKRLPRQTPRAALRLHRAGRDHAFKCAAFGVGGGSEHRDHADVRAIAAADGFQPRSGIADRGQGAEMRRAIFHGPCSDSPNDRGE